MLTRDEARTRALHFVSQVEDRESDGYELIDDATIETAYGWVFHYNSSLYLKTRDPIHALAGNAPVVVMKESGDVYPLGTAHPVEYYLRELEARLDT